MKPEQVRRYADQLVEFHKRFAPLFYEKRQAHWAGKCLHGLLLDGVRKNAAGLARAVPGGNVQSMQQFLSDSPWDPAPVVAELQTLVAEKLGEPDAVIVCDDTGFPKKGDKSVGVARHYSGTLGKVDNCQVGVFLAYVSGKGRSLVDEQLFVPQAWARSKKRRKEAQVPKEVAFRTKPQIALQMIERAHRGALPFRWVCCDDMYGNSGPFRDGLDALGLFYVAEVPSRTTAWIEKPPVREAGQGPLGRPRTKKSVEPGAPRAHALPALAGQQQHWTTIEVRPGTKKPVRSKWAALRVYARRDGVPGREEWLLMERLGGQEHRYYLSNAPLATPVGTLAQVAKKEWFVEPCFRDAKQHVGLGDFEVRKWPAWHHHMVMCMLAQAFLATLRRGSKKGLCS